MLKDDGLLIATFMGPSFSRPIANEPWQPERIGMNVLAHGQTWEVGGPMVLHSEWWIREHWGRAFEILEIREAGFGSVRERGSGATHETAGQGVVLMRKKPLRLTRAELERIEPTDHRETVAMRHNIHQLHGESLLYRGLHRDAEARFNQLEAERDHLRSLVQTFATSRSWKMTAPLRRLQALVRQGSSTR